MNARGLTLIAALSLTTACNSTISRALLLSTPANLTEPCLALEPLPSPATLGDVLQDGIRTAGMYNECRAKHAALSEWSKQ
jgi:hypothetical protein